MDCTFLTDKPLKSEDTETVDNLLKSISNKVTGITIMLYTAPIVIICHVNGDLSTDEKIQMQISIDSINIDAVGM